MSVVRLLFLGFAMTCFAACGGGGSAGSSPTASVTNTTTAAPSTPTTNLGVNLNTIDYWDASRPFMNLIYGSDWQMQATGGWENVPAANLDSNGWIKSLPGGYHAERVLSMPISSADVTCQWQGNDNNSMIVQGASASNVTRTGPNSLRFHYAANYPNSTNWAALSFSVKQHL